MTGPISLRPITAANRAAVEALDPGPGNARFVAPNRDSLAAADRHSPLRPWAVYAGEELVGFVMYGKDADDRNVWIYRLMIAAPAQRRGYGRAALLLTLRRIAAEYGVCPVFIGYDRDNAVARRLYLGLGFEEQGLAPWGELYARLPAAHLLALAEDRGRQPAHRPVPPAADNPAG